MLALQHERARIAAELHDIVGHAISVMVFQAAAGQRLVDADPGGAEVAGPDLSMIDEVVSRAARSGLAVTYRFEGDHSGVDATTAHAAFRIVQESLTNALRHAPGSAVRVLVRGSAHTLDVCVENDRSVEPRPGCSVSVVGSSGCTSGSRS